MVNRIQTNPAMLWPNTANRTINNAKYANASATQSANPTTTQNETVQLDSKALVSASMRLPSGGWMNASVFRSDSYSESNPVYLVKGTNVDGTAFEKEVKINEVNPRNASFIEMFTLDGYYADKGIQLGSTRAAVSAMGASRGSNDAYSKFDFIPPLQEMMETQRFHGNLHGFMQYKHIVDTLFDHISRR